MRDFLSHYLYQKQWSIYPFIPPLFSLLLGLVLIPIYQKLIDKRIDERLQSNGITNDNTGNRLDLVRAAIKTRGLQLAYLTQVPNFAIAIITAAKGNHPNLVIAALILAGCVAFWSLRLFLKKPDYFATTYFPKTRRPEWLAKRGLKQIDLYAYVLPILTVVVIGIIVMTLPEKKTLPGGPARVWTPAQTPVRPFSEAPTADNFIAPGLEGLYAELRKDTQRDVPELQLAAYTPYKSPDTPPNPAAYNIRQIVVKFVEGSAVRLRNGELQQVQETDALQTRGRLPRAGLEPADVQRDLIAINAAIKTMRASIGRAAPMVEEQDLANLRRRAERNVRREMPDLDLFYFAHLPEVDSETAQKFLDQLRLLRVVEVAYFQPIPFDTADIPPTTTIDVTPSQGYFRAAPAGIDVDFARNFSAGRGQGVRIADIESGWHLGHEDLPRASFGFGVNWINSHGTAVLGQIAAEENGFGANGIVPLSMIGTSSVTNLDPFQGVYFYSVASALLMASKVLRVGDIALIEQHFQHFGTRLVCDTTTDPCKNCSIPPWVAVEEFATEHAAISQLTAAGVVVVEAAGNGRTEVTPASTWDSGAIVVGAGNIRLEPMCWSNFGPRVNVQGWGDSIVGTTGYGDLQANGGDANQWYTMTFAGTSSASPIVVGAAAIIQSTRAAAGLPPLNSYDMRSLLMTTGTPQAAGTSPNIGPLPDLRRAIASYLPDAARFVRQTAIPRVVGPGSSFPRSATFVNSGGIAWSGGHTMSVAPSGPPAFQASTFGVGSVGAEVMPEVEVTRMFNITAPTQPGTYNFSIVLRNGSGQVLASSPVQQIVVAPNTLFDDARIAIRTAPGTLLSGRNNQVVIEVTNTGSTTWSTTDYSVGLQRGLRISLPQQSVALRSPVAPGGVQRLTFEISCNGPGQGWFVAQMRRGTTVSFGSPASWTVVCRGLVP